MATQLIKGNHAVVVGALYAGCDCYFGYPITPASEILQEASERFPAVGRRFVQAESEEAAVNMLYGAAAAGHRAMTASSGPGISLKQEGISYLAGAELPAVIIDVQRAGPGLGNIGPEQSDYNQVVKGGGHGAYHCPVLAPDSVQEMCDATRRAFELAFKYRTPVYVLTDGVLGQMIEPLSFPETAVSPAIDESWAVAGTAATRKNLVTSIFLDFDSLEAHNHKLRDKYRAMQVEAEAECHRTEDAEVVLVAYGICARVAKSVVDDARREGVKAGLLRPRTLYPFPTEALRALADGKAAKAFLSVEMSDGQLIDDVRLATGMKKPVELVNRLGGNLLTQDQVAREVKRLLKAWERV